MDIKILENGKLPIVLFTSKAYLKLLALYNTTWAKTYEFMYIGEIEHIKEHNTYVLKNVELIPQVKNSSAYCESDDDKYPIWLQEKYPIKDRKYVRFHGHSHVNMATGPSGTDTQAIYKMMQYVDDFFIQFIMNLKKDYTLNIYNKELNLIYNNVTYNIITEQGYLVDPKTYNIVTNIENAIAIPEKDNIKIGDNLFLNLKNFDIITNDGYIKVIKGKSITPNKDVLELLTKEAEQTAKDLEIKFPTYNSYSYVSSYTKKTNLKDLNDYYDEDDYYHGYSGYKAYNICEDCPNKDPKYCQTKCKCYTCPSVETYGTKQQCDACSKNPIGQLLALEQSKEDKIKEEKAKKEKKGKKKNGSK